MESGPDMGCLSGSWVSGRVESVEGMQYGRSIRENVKVGPGQGAHQVIVLVVEEI